MKHKKLILILHTLLVMQLNFSIVYAIDTKTYTNNYIGNDNLNSVDTNRAKFDSLIRRGDENIWYYCGVHYDTNSIDNAIHNYNKALLIYPNNQETLFKLAYIYDFTDSVAQAKKYYDKVNVMALKIRNNFAKTDYPEIDVKKIKNNFYYNDSLETVFKRYGKESFITFVYDISLSYPDSINIYRIDSYLNKAFNKKIYFTVFGNGEFIARKFDYSCDCKLDFKGILPDSVLVKILKTLENSRILSLKKIFFGQDTDNNDYYIKSNEYLKYSYYSGLLYSEVTNIETPLFSQSIEILDLDNYSNDEMLSLCLSSNINLIYNSTLPDKEAAKLEILKELWKYIFCTDLTYRFDSNKNLTEVEIINDFDSLIKIADENLINNRTIAINNAIQNYKKALLIHPNNQETLFKIAYLYDLSDSVTQAKKYYDKINVMKLTIRNNFAKTEYPEIEVKKIKDNLKYNDSLVNTFRKFGKKSAITLDYDISSSSRWSTGTDHLGIFYRKLFDKKIFVTIYGNGEFEARKYDSLTNSKVYFEGKLPDSILTIILDALQDSRFLSMKSLFDKEENEINRFYGYDDEYILIPGCFGAYNLLYFEQITVESPLFSNSINVLNLFDWKISRNEMQNCNDLKLLYNKSNDDKIRAKLQLLSELWKYIFCMDLSKYSKE